MFKPIGATNALLKAVLNFPHWLESKEDILSVYSIFGTILCLTAWIAYAAVKYNTIAALHRSCDDSRVALW